jgi:hypothetical protein
MAESSGASEFDYRPIALLKLGWRRPFTRSRPTVPLRRRAGAVSKPIMLMLMAGGSLFAGSHDPPIWRFEVLTRPPPHETLPGCEGLPAE